MIRAVALAAELPTWSFASSRRLRPGSPMIDSLVRSGPHDDEAGPRRARDHVVHGVPNRTARTHPDPSQPSIMRMVEARVRST
eukprot:8671249-Heterocapsa_arctica.AAC.1